METLKRYGWQRRAFFLNLVAYILVNGYFAWSSSLSNWLRLYVVFPVSTAWIVFYSWWSL